MGNTILGSNVFISKMTLGSLSKTCQMAEKRLNGRKVVVVDMPGFSGSWYLMFLWQYTITEITKSVNLCSPGPHVILWVIHQGHFAQEEKDMAQLIQEIFSLKGKNYMILLFTHNNDQEGQTFEQFISQGGSSLKDRLDLCGNRFLVFNNKAEGEEQEALVAQLLKMTDDLVERNGEAPCYTEDMLKIDLENVKKKPSQFLVLPFQIETLQDGPFGTPQPCFSPFCILVVSKNLSQRLLAESP
ncbi:GTPase IMAP family member 7-like [Notechis scutatus]|uniref:GTPase IMAP family member 7-like n=1 Tax=Notechis scutatus TaxID=8663 RepID=A0A6J1VWF9_9SAUR|nr:GTPase IMAP family member 7-like [Notechis scutatus]